MIAWMIYAVTVGALLSAAALAAERVCLNARTSTRWCWSMAMTATALVPIVLPLRAGGSGGADASAAAASVGQMQVVGAAAAVGAGGFDVERALVLAWVAASGVLVLLFTTSMLALARERRRWRHDFLCGSCVRVSDRSGPAVVGFLAPEIVVPAWVLHGGGDEVRLLVAHEREHQTAHDPLLLLWGLILVGLFPWNLPLWWQLRRLRLAVEVDCDARVLRRHPDRKAYGDLLLEVGLRASGTSLAAAFAGGRTSLERRLLVLSRPRRLTLARAAGLGGVAVAAVLAACAIPSPDAPGVGGLLEPAIEEPAAAGAPSEPAFTPYDVKPELRNREDVPAILRETYPRALREAGVGGTVTLWLLIDEQGAVTSTRVAKGAGDARLDLAAGRAARRLSFTPAMHRGVTVPVWIQLPVTYVADEPAAEEESAGSEPVRIPVAHRPGAAEGEAAAPPARPEADSPARPTFTPYDVTPELRDREELLRSVLARYPAHLKAAGVGGTTTVWIFIDETGSVRSSRVAQSSGHPELDQAALEVVRVARFTPARHRGEAVPVWIQIPLTFEANGS